MSTERKNVELLVGVFLLIGICFIAVMVVMFGRVGQALKKTYEITILFPNANGLVKDSDVLLAGARIGLVAESPILVGTTYAVQVKLKIREEIKIPKKALFLVGSSGLMGDRFVDVAPQPGFNPNDIIEPNSVLAGSPAAGIEQLTAKGSDVLDQLNSAVAEIKTMSGKINEKLLHERNLKNLEETLAGLKETSASFNESAKKLGPILDDAKVAVDSAKGTMTKADAAAGDLRLAIADIRKTAESASETMDSAQDLFKSAKEGKGPLGTLISDRQAAEDLKVFLANLRRSGPIFYKNRPIATPRPSERAPRR